MGEVAGKRRTRIVAILASAAVAGGLAVPWVGADAHHKSKHKHGKDEAGKLLFFASDGLMQQSVEEQQNLIKVCNDKKLEVQQVLEFFGQDKVASVVKASPKLHDPSEQAAGNPAN